MRPILDHIRALERYFAGSGGTLMRLPMSEWRLGQQGGDQICLRAGLSPEQELPTLVHELVHWLEHQDIQSDPDRTICEYEAEAVEALVLARLGLQELIADANRYPAADPAASLLLHSRHRVQRASERICAALGVPAQRTEA